MRTSSTESQMLTLLSMFVDTDSDEQVYVFSKRDVDLLCRHVRRTRVDDAYNDLFNNRNAWQLLRLTLALGSDRVVLRRSHELQGIAYLWSQYKKPWLAGDNHDALRILQGGTDGFYFVGVTEYGQHTAPRYKVTGSRGSFEYEAWAWQSGRQPKLNDVVVRRLAA